MENQFVTFEIAQLLKELGFNLPTFAMFDESGNFIFIPYNEDNINAGEMIEDHSSDVKSGSMKLSPNFNCSAPLWQQAIDWTLQAKGRYILYKTNEKLLEEDMLSMLKHISEKEQVNKQS